MGPITAVGSVLRQYARFSGRARRSEYWWWTLFTLAVFAVTGLIDSAGDSTAFEGGGPVSGVATLALVLPNLAVEVRRLHDTDRRGWWVLLSFLPILGWIVLLVFYVMRGTGGPNRFGPSPEPGAAGPSGARAAEDQQQTA